MLTKRDLHNLKDLIGDVVTEKLQTEIGENYKERFERMEKSIDACCKISADTRDEQVLTQAKVDNHEERVSILESHFATT